MRLPEDDKNQNTLQTENPEVLPDTNVARYRGQKKPGASWGAPTCPCSWRWTGGNSSCTRPDEATFAFPWPLQPGVLQTEPDSSPPWGQRVSSKHPVEGRMPGWGLRGGCPPAMEAPAGEVTVSGSIIVYLSHPESSGWPDPGFQILIQPS